MRCTILCGIPGSGKTTYAKREFPAAKVLSADDFFMVGVVSSSDHAVKTEYRFDPTQLPAAHGSCLRRFIEAVQERRESIVVDNTNTTTAEIAPYAAVALAYGYTLQVLVIEADPEAAFARNVHGVPLKACQAMAKRLESLDIPPWWVLKRVTF